MPKKQTEWTRSYNERAYARLEITIPKARKEEVRIHAKSRINGGSINGLVNLLLRTDMGLSEEDWKKE